MKESLSASEFGRVLRSLQRAIDDVAEVATLLDSAETTESISNEAKRLEMELNILESRVRKAPGYSPYSNSASHA
jgi:hypothetical protein